MIVRQLGPVAYDLAVDAMRAFTEARGEDSEDELWLCEHPPVYTLGVAGRLEHVREPGAIPVVRSDRGGQVTYHGPGQVVAYPLVDLRRLGIYVREYVFRLEQALLKTLAAFDVTGHRVRGEPGVYVRCDDPSGHAVHAPPSPEHRFAGLAKIAAIGVKVSRHRAWHGCSLNVAMDLRPYAGIDPCGHAGLAMTDLSTIGVQATPRAVAATLGEQLAATLGRQQAP